MIEAKLLVGRYLEFLTPHPQTKTTPAPPGFRPLASQIMHIAESQSMAKPVAATTWPQGYRPPASVAVKTGLADFAHALKGEVQRQQTSAMAAGPAVKAHRNFVWLEWVPGFVSQVDAGSYDVLTGPMSGCWIITFTLNNTRYVLHVGTEDDANTANSLAAKASWNQFAAKMAPGSVTGFNPFRDWIGPRPQAQADELPNMKNFALVTSDGRFFAVYWFGHSAQPSRKRIAGVQELRNSLLPGFQI